MPRLRFKKTVVARAYTIQDPPSSYTSESTTECKGHPTQDWQRRRETAAIQKFNYRHSDQKDFPLQIPESNDKYMTIKRPPPTTEEQPESTQQKLPKLNDYNEANHDVTTTTIQPSISETPNSSCPERNPSPHPDNFPTSLNSIKEFIHSQDEDHYLPLMSTINLEKRRRMLYRPLEFGEITLEGLVDSSA